jgi:hypothetical protein
MLLLEDKIAKIAEHIETCTNFGGNLETDDFSVLDDLSWELYHIDKGIRINHGVSKVAIIIPNCSKVIKIPFNGQYELIEEDEESLEYEEEWVPFTQASSRNEDNPDDYCREEVEFYNLAKEKGLEKFFAKTTFYSYSPDGTSIYLQEKVIPVEDDVSKRRSSDRAKKIVKEKDWTNIINKQWLELAVDYYGEVEVEKFISFLQKNDMLSDLHNGNIGFGLYDNRPLILDFSNWND